MDISELEQILSKELKHDKRCMSCMSSYEMRLCRTRIVLQDSLSILERGKSFHDIHFHDPIGNCQCIIRISMNPELLDALNHLDLEITDLFSSKPI
jgi:hypothetical protein